MSVEQWRLFIALELPADTLAALTATQEQLQREAPPRTVRWVRPAGIHLTLKFLGDTPAHQQEAISTALHNAASDQGPLLLRAAGLGCFPNVRRPRVVWVGLDGDMAPLRALYEAVETALTPLGFPREKRGFSLHLTLGRVRREASPDAVQNLGRLIEQTKIGTLHTWTAATVSLVRSELHPDGARYTVLSHAPLLGL
ncbi:RNA 2',3'-cyclic phosphodiesterase [Chloroflexota bacterium]